MKIFGFYVTREDNLARAIDAETAAAFLAGAHARLAERFDALSDQPAELELKARAELAEAALLEIRNRLQAINRDREQEEVAA